MITVGDKGRWWNRKIPIGKILFGAGLCVAGLWLAAIVADPVSDVWWGMTHGWTAEYRGRSFRVPYMWRQMEQKTGGSFALRNSTEILRSGFPLDTITIFDETDHPLDPNSIERFKQVQEGLEKYGLFKVDKDWGNNDVKQTYECVAASSKQNSFVTIDCFHKSGKWHLTMWGNQASIDDFDSVLQAIATLPDPVPWPKK